MKDGIVDLPIGSFFSRQILLLMRKDLMCRDREELSTNEILFLRTCTSLLGGKSQRI